MSQALSEFERRQTVFSETKGLPVDQLNFLSNPKLLDEFNILCGEGEAAGNAALMRLAPVPLFFHRSPEVAVEYAGVSGQTTHGDQRVYGACQYYGALIVAALQKESKEKLLSNDFYSDHRQWFANQRLHRDILSIAHGSYKKRGGYSDGIRSSGYIVTALEAALWAFWSTSSFEEGALAAVNLGEFTDSVAGIYGQLAGAYYGYKKLPCHWVDHVYGRTFILTTSKWIAYEGSIWQRR